MVSLITLCSNKEKVSPFNKIHNFMSQTVIDIQASLAKLQVRVTKKHNQHTVNVIGIEGLIIFFVKKMWSVMSKNNLK